MALVDRWYNILYILETNPGITQQELEKILGTSRQTLKKNIMLLNKEIEGIACITFSDQVYNLEIIKFDEYDKILMGRLKKESDFNSASKRIAYILKRFIEQDETILIDDLSQELSVSRGTVTNDINNIRNLIRSYNVDIIGMTNKGLKISGSEHNLRLIYINIVLEYFPVERITESTKQKLILKCRELNISKQSLNLLLRVIDTTFMRIKLGNNLEYENEFYQNFLVNTETFEHLITFLEVEYNITLSGLERDFICYPLNIFNQGSDTGKEYQFDKVETVFNQMMIKIHKLFIIEFDEVTLFEDIKIHLAHLINRITMGVRTKDLFLNELETKYPLSYTIAKVATQAISNVMNHPVPEVEISYLTLYIEMAISRNNKTSRRDIAVICHTGRGTAELIKRQLQRVLGSNVDVTAYSQSEVTDTLLSEYFAIFTTIPLRINVKNIPIIQLSSIFDETYVRQQWELVEKTRSINNDHIEALVTTLNNELSYKENLEKMTESLRKNMLTDSGFAQRIIEREEIKSTIFDKGIAVPHAINKFSQKIVLNFGKFNKPFETEHGNVEIVFMLGIPKDNINEIENVLLDLYDFFFAAANSPNLKQSLIDAESSEEIKLLIQKEVI